MGNFTLTGLPLDRGVVVFQCLAASFAFLKKSLSTVPTFSSFTSPSEKVLNSFPSGQRFRRVYQAYLKNPVGPLSVFPPIPEEHLRLVARIRPSLCLPE